MNLDWNCKLHRLHFLVVNMFTTSVFGKNIAIIFRFSNKILLRLSCIIINIIIQTYRVVNENCAIMLVQAGMQAKHFAAAFDRACSITNFNTNCPYKSFFFFLKTQRRLVLKFVSIRRNHIVKKIFHSWKQDIYVFIKGIMPELKTNVWLNLRLLLLNFSTSRKGQCTQKESQWVLLGSFIFISWSGSTSS